MSRVRSIFIAFANEDIWKHAYRYYISRLGLTAERDNSKTAMTRSADVKSRSKHKVTLTKGVRRRIGTGRFEPLEEYKRLNSASPVKKTSCQTSR